MRLINSSVKYYFKNVFEKAEHQPSSSKRRLSLHEFLSWGRGGGGGRKGSQNASKPKFTGEIEADASINHLPHAASRHKISPSP